MGRRGSRLLELRDRRPRRHTLYWKIFGKKFPDQSRITNCNQGPLSLGTPLTCSYGAVTYSGNQSLLDGFVTMDHGRRSDLMSYVVAMDAAGSPAWTASDPEKALTPTQLEVIGLYANAPWMGGYRNFAHEP